MWPFDGCGYSLFFFTSANPSVRSLTNGSWGMFKHWSSKAVNVLLHGFRTDWREEGRGSSSMVFPLTGQLLTVVFPRVSFGAPVFVIYINDLDLSLFIKMFKLADYNKLEIDARNWSGICEVPAKGPCSHWRMVHGLADALDLDKSHVLHVCTAYQAEKYPLLGSEIFIVTQERDPPTAT